MSYFDADGLSHLITIIKEHFNSTLKLGEEANTAFRGDHGRDAYIHSTSPHAPFNAEANVQADWSEVDDGSAAFIQNKPDSLKNPHSIQFTGGVSETYDGSSEVEVAIPTAYTHPSYTPVGQSGLYKITVDATGHVNKVTAATKQDILELGFEESSSYGNATQENPGLMSTQDKKKLDGFEESTSYAKKADIVSVYRYKGSLTNESKLPKSAETGDVYNLESSTTYGDGMNVGWDGTKWDTLGQKFDVVDIGDTQIKDAWDSVFESDLFPGDGDGAGLTADAISGALGYTPDARPKKKTMKLLPAGWTGSSFPYLYTIDIPGVTTTQSVYVTAGEGLTQDQINAFADSAITGKEQQLGKVILQAVRKPSIELPIVVVVGGDVDNFV